MLLSVESRMETGQKLVENSCVKHKNMTFIIACILYQNNCLNDVCDSDNFSNHHNHRCHEDRHLNTELLSCA